MRNVAVVRFATENKGKGDILANDETIDILLVLVDEFLLSRFIMEGRLVEIVELREGTGKGAALAKGDKLKVGDELSEVDFMGV